MILLWLLRYRSIEGIVLLKLVFFKCIQFFKLDFSVVQRLMSSLRLIRIRKVAVLIPDELPIQVKPQFCMSYSSKGGGGGLWVQIFPKNKYVQTV